MQAPCLFSVLKIKNDISKNFLQEKFVGFITFYIKNKCIAKFTFIAYFCIAK